MEENFLRGAYRFQAGTLILRGGCYRTINSCNTHADGWQSHAGNMDAAELFNPPIITVASVDREPYSFKCALNTWSVRKQVTNCSTERYGRGIGVDLLSHLLEYANYHNKVILVPSDYHLGSPRDNTGLLGAIANRTIDTIAVPIQMTHLNQLEFTYPLFDTYPVLLIKKETADFMSSTMLVFKVFDVDMWTVLLGTMASIVAFLYLVPRCSFGKVAGRRDAHGKISLWEYFRYCVDQCWRDMTQSTFSANAALVWLGLIVVLYVSLYQGCLLTQLLKQTTNANPNEGSIVMDDIRNGNRMIITNSNKEHLLSEFDFITTDIKVRRAFDKAKTERNLTKLALRIKEENLVYPVDNIRAEYITSSVDTVTSCALTIVPMGEKFKRRKLQSFAFVKGSPWVAKLDKAIVMTQAYAETNIKKYTMRSASCDAQGPIGAKALGLYALSGLFIMFSIGSALAAAGYMYERMVHAGWCARADCLL